MNIVFLSLKIDFLLAKSEYTDEMPHYAAFHLGPHSLQKISVRGVSDFRGLIYIRAVTCDFQQCGILRNVDSDEPVQSSFKLRRSQLCSVSSLTVLEYPSD